MSTGSCRASNQTKNDVQPMDESSDDAPPSLTPPQTKNKSPQPPPRGTPQRKRSPDNAGSVLSGSVLGKRTTDAAGLDKASPSESRPFKRTLYASSENGSSASCSSSSSSSALPRGSPPPSGKHLINRKSPPHERSQQPFRQLSSELGSSSSSNSAVGSSSIGGRQSTASPMQLSPPSSRRRMSDDAPEPQVHTPSPAHSPQLSQASSERLDSSSEVDNEEDFEELFKMLSQRDPDEQQSEAALLSDSKRPAGSSSLPGPLDLSSPFSDDDLLSVPDPSLKSSASSSSSNSAASAASANSKPLPVPSFAAGVSKSKQPILGPRRYQKPTEKLKPHVAKQLYLRLFQAEILLETQEQFDKDLFRDITKPDHETEYEYSCRVAKDGTISLNNPKPKVLSNRLSRKFGSHRLLRVQYEMVSSKEEEKEAKSVFKEVRAGELHIAGRVFKPLLWKGDRDIWFAESGPGIQHLTCDAVRDWLGDFSSISIACKLAMRLQLALSDSVEGLSLGRGQSHSSSSSSSSAQSNDGKDAKTASRSSNSGSPPVQVSLIDDIKSSAGHLLTDGCGLISFDCALTIQQVLGCAQMPTAFQVRAVCHLGGFKGMLLVTDGLVNEIRFRQSMKKFDCPHGTKDLPFADTDCTLDIVATPHAPRRFNLRAVVESVPASLTELTTQARLYYTRLSHILILLLYHRGVPRDFFMQLLKQDVAQLKARLTDVEDVKNSLRPEQLSPYNSDSLGFEVLSMVVAGFTPQEPHLASRIHSLNRNIFAQLREKASVHCPASAHLYAVPDPTRKLKPAQVFIKVDGVQIRGPVVATRFPCMKPSDIRVLEAVDADDLQYVDNLIVFDVASAQSEIANMGGGDFDGDTVWVCWDKRVVVPILAADAKRKATAPLLPPATQCATGPVPPSPHSALKLSTASPAHSPMTKQSPLPPPPPPSPRAMSLQQRAHECFFENLFELQNAVGRISNAHLIIAATLGPDHAHAIELADLFCVAIDAPKTGSKPQLPQFALDALSKPKPRWLAKKGEEYDSRPSTCLLDEMHEFVLKQDPQLLLARTVELAKPDPDLTRPITSEMLKQAEKKVAQFRSKLVQQMFDEFAVDDRQRQRARNKARRERVTREARLRALNVQRVSGAEEEAEEQFNPNEPSEFYSGLARELRSEFLSDFGDQKLPADMLDDSAAFYSALPCLSRECKERMYDKASAWYQASVNCHDERGCKFAWLSVRVVLIDMKLRAGRSLGVASDAAFLPFRKELSRLLV